MLLDENEGAYKGKEVSMKEYILEKYGEPTMFLIDMLLR